MTITTTYNIAINGRIVEDLSGIQDRRQALLLAAQRWERGAVVVVMSLTSKGKCRVERTITEEGKFK